MFTLIQHASGPAHEAMLALVAEHHEAMARRWGERYVASTGRPPGTRSADARWDKLLVMAAQIDRLQTLPCGPGSELAGSDVDLVRVADETLAGVLPANALAAAVVNKNQCPNSGLLFFRAVPEIATLLREIHARGPVANPFNSQCDQYAIAHGFQRKKIRIWPLNPRYNLYRNAAPAGLRLPVVVDAFHGENQAARMAGMKRAVGIGRRMYVCDGINENRAGLAGVHSGYESAF